MEIQYALLSMNETEFSFNYDIDYDNFDESKVQLKFANKITVDKKKEELVISFDVYICSVTDDVIYAKNSIRTVFGMKPFNDVIEQTDDDSFKVKAPDLIDTFINVTIGAVGGMFAKNLKGTPLNKFILPLIPMSMIRKTFMKK